MSGVDLKLPLILDTHAAHRYSSGMDDNEYWRKYWSATLRMVKGEARSRALDFERYNKFGIYMGTLMDGLQWCLFL